MPSFEFENLFPGKIIYGVDEAGLGALAGPLVVVACRILNNELPAELFLNIDDSKRLSPRKREHLFEIIQSFEGIDYVISIVENSTIDKIGLSNAWKFGILQGIQRKKIEVCLIDGSRKVDVHGIEVLSIVKGDRKSFTIATASIIAKVTRDRIMRSLHEEFPCYGFDRHVGYSTKMHLEMIHKFGPCKYHRFSYAPIKNIVRNTQVKV